MDLRLSDAVLAPYRQMAVEFKQPLEAILEKQLSRFAAFAPTVRVVPLARDPLQEVETLLGGGQIQSGQVLAARVRDYASISIGKIVLDLTPAQKAEIAHRAQKRGMSPDDVVKELIGVIMDSVFDQVTPYR